MGSLESGQESAGSMEEGREDKPSKRLPLKMIFLTCIGAHEYLSQEMWRAAVTELVATAGLMFTLSTSIVSCLESKVADPKLLVPIPIFIILLLFLIVTLPISGGHMSPIITFIAALKGVVTFARAAVYVLAQCVGSILGFAVVKIVMSQEAAQKFSLGGCVVDATGSQGLSPEVALTLEFSCTFVFLFISVTVAFDEKRSKELGLNLVCVILAGVAAVVMFISIVITGEPGYAGVGLNPARCLGPAILHGGPLWKGHWVFWVGPFLACVSYYFYSLTLPKEREVLPEKEYELVNLVKACYVGIEPQYVKERRKK